QSNDFFVEDFRSSRWNGNPPKGEEFLVEHVRRYSQVKIAEEYGIHYFAEPNFSHMGQLLDERGPAYVTDNRRHIRVNNWVDENGQPSLLAAAEPLRISEEFAYQVAEVLRNRLFLALFHPQWYA